MPSVQGLGASCTNEAAKKILRCIGDSPLQWPFLMPSKHFALGITAQFVTGVRGAGFLKLFSLKEYTDTVEMRTVR